MISELITLFINFFYIGAFAFGGGYTMIPMFQRMVEEQGWMSIERFTDMIAVSQMTPGPIAVNMATFIGFQTASVAGSLVATLAVCMPSFILVIILIKFVMAFEENRYIVGVLNVLRPVVAGLIAAAAYLIAVNSPLVDFDSFEKSGQLLQLIDPLSAVLALGIIYAIYKFKKHPIMYVLISGVVGAIWM